MNQPPKVLPDRWRLHRAGLVNIWRYLDNEFDLPGGRMILRGTNGSGKSRALEMLLPFLLDADRRKMDATGSGRVNLHELMRVGADDQSNRLGYAWLELVNNGEYLTLGALVRSSKSANTTAVWYFMTPKRVGHDLQLLSDAREPLSRQALSEIIGASAITDVAETHRERVRAEVFGLNANSTHDRDRFSGLLQLLHTLRAPDVGNRIDEGRLPQILSDSLPPLDEQTLQRAGDQLDGLTTLRHEQQRLAESHEHVQAFLDVYSRYAATVVVDTATNTLAAVEAADAADKAAQAALSELERLKNEEATIRSNVESAEAAEKELRYAIQGLQARDIFKQADELAQRDRVVDTQAITADAAIDEARRARTNHERSVTATDERLADLAAEVGRCATALTNARDALSSAHLPDSGLPGEIRLVQQPRNSTSVVLRLRRDSEPEPVVRPEPVLSTLVPEDSDEARNASTSASEAARQRAELAERRLLEARRLDRAEQAVQRLEGDAEGEAQRAESDQQEADTTERTRDDVAVALALGWRTWIAQPETSELLGVIDWPAHPALAPLSLDVEALCGDIESSGELDRLDTVAAEQSGSARQTIAADHAQLDLDQRSDEAQRRLLAIERDQLEREVDPAPEDSPWLLPERPGIPLWRTIDFADDVPDADRAGIEAALLASGLLTAHIERDGALQADDGTVLLSPNAIPAYRPLSTVLRPDPAGPAEASLVAQVLNGIGFDDDSPTSIRADGNWRHGSLRGRHTAAVARHIGAAARAHARRQRLDAIAAELASLLTRQELRDARRAELTGRANAIDTLVNAAPRSTELRTARRVASNAVVRARSSRARATEAGVRARTARTTWSTELKTHRDTCELHSLPAEVDGLDRARLMARDADRACADLSKSLRSLQDSSDRHRRSVDESLEQAVERDAAQNRADSAWRDWQQIAAEVAAIHEAIDLTVEQARHELSRSQKALSVAETESKSASERLLLVIGRSATAANQSLHAQETAGARQEEMVAAGNRFTHRIGLRGLVSAATDSDIRGIERPEQSESVRAAATTVISTVPRPAHAANVDLVLRAFQTFDRNVAGQLDVTTAIDDGITLVTVAGTGDDHTLVGASVALETRLTTGRAALSEREREVFTTFVLGGVAEELRRRINQARTLVDAMNASLKTIQTSNGIAVRLTWRLASDAADLHRIAELIRTADAVRSTAQNDELTDLLRQRVDEFYSADPSSGYAVHLAQALDYRRWHDVEVTILGPNPGETRRISSRAKLSEGETRFVSYVTLFAAADAYLSGLSRSGRQLRLVLLDDAFAKVDDPTIAEFMGLLVRLDVDFVMTGHDLWGCYPEVPSLDIYEVRREEGTSAVTIHHHWDGYRRHLRSSE